ncbi:hypothetical protein GCM10010885_03510 [Alicyclobacillus cellulosilyticus]|uniref:Uncharacterized protein n=1 Tax=Alicyclobacillus cellulosilyticus TaxID=1003997 RepID=A0A917K1G9_9BACL|nr:hypothetical protein GCM10010885_03510 [Alicyclobacillus cellulosilyticus]
MVVPLRGEGIRLRTRPTRRRLAVGVTILILAGVLILLWEARVFAVHIVTR